MPGQDPRAPRTLPAAAAAALGPGPAPVATTSVERASSIFPVRSPSVEAAPGELAARSRSVEAAPGAVAPGDQGVDPLHDHVPGPTLRHDLLTTLRRTGPASPDQLATRLGASRTGVLQQLRTLESAGLVSRQAVRHGVGRPRHLYDVTPDAQGLFPTNYDGLASGLLAAIGAVGGDALLEEVFQARRRQLSDRLRTRLAERVPAGAPLVDRVRELAVLQDEQGYLCQAEFEPDGTVRLREHNCAIYHVAMGMAAACDAELQLFREVLDADVVRDSHIASGDRSCSYRIVERPPKS